MNVIMLVDVYAVAADDSLESLKQCRAAVLELVQAGDIKPSTIAANPIVVSPVREAWKTEKPIVTPNVNDADFEAIKGKTTQEVYEFLFKKPA